MSRDNPAYYSVDGSVDVQAAAGDSEFDRGVGTVGDPQRGALVRCTGCLCVTLGLQSLFRVVNHAVRKL